MCTEQIESNFYNIHIYNYVSTGNEIRLLMLCDNINRT